ncbi:polyprenyl synthetase family protein [Candidatus Uhrbacteria bacterium]|nr:polyprenyl synthetase family protein [Candidatus Uhrbacteria bacterium]
MTFEERYRNAVEALFREDITGFAEGKTFCLGGGKRLRPQLLLDAADAWGADTEDAGHAAVGVELLHQYFLIHDDIMDGDDLRRDQPTLHRAVAMRFGDAWGTGVALAVGDHVSNEAFRLFAASSPNPATALAVCRLATDVTEETIAGQLREYVTQTAWTRKDLEQFYCYKTAAYSFRLPLMIADILDGTDAARVMDIESAARDLGVAYQFHDDLIEFRGEKRRAEAGGGDIARGKMTIVLRLILDAMEAGERERLLLEWKASGRIGEERVQELREFAHRRHILEDVTSMIASKVAAALPILQRLRIADAPSVRMLLEFFR